MKASPQKGGHGHITSYRIAIGSAAAKRCGLVGANGERYELEAIEMPENKAILVRVMSADDAFKLQE